MIFRSVKFRYGGVHIPHYAIRIVMWVVVTDDWVATNYIRLRFDGTYKYRYYNIHSNTLKSFYRYFLKIPHFGPSIFVVEVPMKSLPSVTGLGP